MFPGLFDSSQLRPSNSMLAGMAAGSQNSEQDELIKLLKKYMNQQQGNQWYNPNMKGPDWGSGLSSIIDSLPPGLLGSLLGLGKMR